MKDGFFKAVRNMFIETEEDDEDEVKVSSTQVTIPTPEKKHVDKVEIEDVEEDIPVREKPLTVRETPIVKEEVKVVEKLETEVPKPRFREFGLEDFSNDVEPENRHIEEYKYTKSETIVKPSSYGIRKEEKKVFIPTPIISPIYGVLDKNYRKEEIKDKKRRPTTIYSQFDKIDVDDIRKKAYGTLEDELESNINSRNGDAVIFNDDIDAKLDDDKEITDYEEQPLDIFKELDKKDALDNLLDSYNVENSIEDNLDNDIESESLLEDLDEDYNYDEVDNDGLVDDDLFDLIDSMYNKED